MEQAAAQKTENNLALEERGGVGEWRRKEIESPLLLI